VVTVNSVVTVQYQIAASTDDTHCNSATNWYYSYYISFPDSSDAYRSFLRWAVTIPDGPPSSRPTSRSRPGPPAVMRTVRMGS